MSPLLMLWTAPPSAGESHECGCCYCLSNKKLLRCVGRFWHIASFCCAAKIGRYWRHSGHRAGIASTHDPWQHARQRRANARRVVSRSRLQSPFYFRRERLTENETSDHQGQSTFHRYADFAGILRHEASHRKPLELI